MQRLPLFAFLCKWCCPCGHLWHHCPQHRAPGFAAGSGKRSSRAGVRRATPKPLGHTQDPREGAAMRAGIVAADLQASWDSSSLLGPVAALLAAQVPSEGRNDASRPPPRRRKAQKTSHHLGKNIGIRTLTCKDPPVEAQHDTTLRHAPPSCPPPAALRGLLDMLRFLHALLLCGSCTYLYISCLL